MEPCSFVDVEQDFDTLVAKSATVLDADPVCSTTRWIIPAAAAFAPTGKPRVFRGEHGMIAMLEHDNPNGPVLTSFDCMWGFATPLIGPAPAALVDEIRTDLLPQLDYYALSISGIDRAGALFDELQRLHPVGYNNTADRCVADLTSGFDDWLGRRSSRFRRSLRAAVNRGQAEGLSIESVSPATGEATVAVLGRVLEVEATSWKTGANSGLIDTDLGSFTHAMAQRFAQTGDLRVMLARHEGRDIGYVIGGIVGDRYRGFQHSFDQDYAELSIGKFLQHHTIQAIAAEGVTTYDMGMNMDYKRSYADRIESTVTLIFANRS